VADAKDPKLALFELYLATAEKVSDRRAQANSWMISVNSAMSVGSAQKMIWLWAIPSAGALVCLAWAALVTSYRKLNRAKFAVLRQIEVELSISLFASEREAYRRDRRRSLSYVETFVPVCFALLYFAMLVAAVVAHSG
jgi:hypothetical protein